jgi:hypothetical protein
MLGAEEEPGKMRALLLATAVATLFFSSPALKRDEVTLIQSIVIAKSEATKQSSTAVPHWIASLRSQ